MLCPEFRTSRSISLKKEKNKKVQVPMIMFIGRAETPKVMEISTSKTRPPMRIESATQTNLKEFC